MNGPVLLLGNQNSGKSTLFNALTGLNAKVANYPGVTVEASMGEILDPTGRSLILVDLPGTYSLIPASEEEELTLKAVFGQVPSIGKNALIVMVIDATELRRGLYLYSQIIELGFKAIIALSMVDQQPLLKNPHNISIFQKAVGTYVIPISAHDKPSIIRLKTTIESIVAGSLRPQIKEQPLLFTMLDEALQHKLSVMGTQIPHALPEHAQNSVELIRNHNIYLYRLVRGSRLKLSEKNIEHLRLNTEDKKALDKVITDMPEHRFARVDKWIKDLHSGPDKSRARSDMVDKFLLHPLFGSLFLILLFVTLLQGLFLLAQPMADHMADLINVLGQAIGSLLPEKSMIKSLVIDGIFEGVGSILAFLPLIALLFLFMGILEDSGYLARATYLLDATLKRFGLCGRSLTPMLSGFACAVPAIVATRTIGSRSTRLITILVTPFLTCSARLPIYGLIVGALFSAYPPLFGVINCGAFIFALMYALGLIAALGAASILAKIIKSDSGYNLNIELPPYRWPGLSINIKRVFRRISSFVRDVGSVILASTIVIWSLFHFEPHRPPQPDAVVSEASRLEHSYAGVIGKSIEPLLRPLGLDWQVGVGIVASFLAREVFVSTMGVVYGLQPEVDPSPGIKNAIKKHISPLSGLCLLIFFTLSMQCVSTLATTAKESGSMLWALLQFAMMTGSAYVLALLTYYVGNLCGFA
jgi:ferrous iron transport protein B